MKKRRTALRELQDLLQKAIVTGDANSILPLLRGNSRTGPETLLAVYQNAYAARLVEVVGNDHPMLRAYVGEDMFVDLAHAYIAAHPSRTPNARWFSSGLPEFLSSTAPYPESPELAEMAALERTLGNAFDAPDEPVLTLADLATIDADRWSDLVFAPHPSAARLNQRTNALGIWRALKAEATPPAAEISDQPQRLLIWRDDVMPKVRVLDAEEAMMWDEAVKAVPFGALCEMLATFDDPEQAALRAAQYLQGWIIAGALSTAKLGKRRRSRRALLDQAH